jgi:hypothetical protein
LIWCAYLTLALRAGLIFCHNCFLTRHTSYGLAFIDRRFYVRLRADGASGEKASNRRFSLSSTESFCRECVALRISLTEVTETTYEFCREKSIWRQKALATKVAEAAPEKSVSDSAGVQVATRLGESSRLSYIRRPVAGISA